MIDRTLAHYRITEKLGEGGMGEVWKAVDTTLEREVAIKILPEAVATDPDRLARFEREAKLLASLNHPNIASVYGLHEADGVRFIAMEFVEGQDLSERLKQGPLPVDDALEVGRRIAMALEVAHGQGVIHRDLKPANVLMLPNGQVKVLDFGLAKAFSPDAASSGSPTFTATVTSAGTRAGVILGTAAYMSPEQARGKELDKRTDIWSFGCLLFECLTGESPFAGETVSDSIGAILHKELDWAKLPQAVPPTVRLMLRRCLARDPGQRVHDIADARIELDPAQRDASASVVGLAMDAEAQSSGQGRGLKPWTIAAGVVLGLFVGAAVGIALRPAPAPTTSLKLDLGAPLETMQNGAEAAVSRAGGHVVYTQPSGLRVQALNEFESRALDGTEGALAPVWSPDGSHIAYFGGTKLWKIAATGGQPVALCDLGSAPTGGRGLYWGEDDRLFYSRGDAGVFEVSTRGGDPQVIVPLEENEGDLHEPFELPGNAGLVFISHPGSASPGLLYVVKDGERDLIFSAADGESLHNPVYDPSGFILFERSRGDATAGLWALPFSAESRKATGDAFLVSPGASSATVTDDGTLVFVHGNSVQSGARQLVWVDRQGRRLDAIGGQRNIAEPTLSPDGSRLAFSMLDTEANNLDLWVRNLERGTETRLTFEPTWDVSPLWSRDGSEVFFLSFQPGMLIGNLWTQRVPADGSKTPERFAQGFASGTTPDGAMLVIRPQGEEDQALSPQLMRTLHRVPLDGSEESILISRPQRISGATVSKDGSLIAYSSDVSGRDEVYLTRYPQATGRWQVSNNGGEVPVWDPRGDRLYFLENGTLHEVMVEGSADGPRLSLPAPLFDVPDTPGNSTRYAVSLDGQKLIVAAEATKEQEQQRRTAIRVVTHWRNEFD